MPTLLALSLLAAGAFAWALDREQRNQVSQQRESVRGGVSVPSPWGDVYDVPNPEVQGGPAFEPGVEPSLNPGLNHAEPHLNPVEPTLNRHRVRTELAQPSTGDGFPRWCSVELVTVGNYSPYEGGLSGVSGEYLDWCELHQSGVSQSATIWQMWGAKKGASKRYLAAKARHDHFARLAASTERHLTIEDDEDEQSD